ncbi:hypothetical protein PTE30175_05013 [Pandoraea terrae]|uniref:Uncharacterized protein n=1 Tax=Pandoraea terrae TaxID=1537710 RepID=A0A5E4Z5W9_9BURK|nr:hypothetical protein [Pandoraea terrae]VVE56641.1 hypothetical protein PTE30175_05013 [Pandoraea terrae]
MATLVRRAYKILLFLFIWLYSIKHVHIYPVPDYQLTFWYGLSGKLGIQDANDLIVPTMMICQLVTAVVVYILLIRLWRICARRFWKDT